MSGEDSNKTYTRVWSDGCYDMVHFGHANQLRQAKAMGDYLYVGVHSDEEISKHKGPPVFTAEERYKMVRGIKWVDEVIESAPYVTTLETLNQYDCNFCVHGDDITCTADGQDAYHIVKSAGRSNQEMPGINQTRIWCDGCFDLVHFGHANMLRQARSLGDKLVVGIHSDDAIKKHKGLPVFTEQERCKMIKSIKWVDEVYVGSPFDPTVEWLDKMKCVFLVHGEDISLTADGKDCYENIKLCHRYKECKRTEGVSTTNLVGRMLLMTKSHFTHGTPICSFSPEQIEKTSSDSSTKSPYTGVSHFLPSSQKIVQFSDGKDPEPGDRIVYAAGAFDMFHVGLLDFLEKAKALGDYLIVGLHTDLVVNRYKGSNYPIMNLHERVLSVLACRYVNQVIIGAPYKVTEELVKQFKINVVVHGKTPIMSDVDGEDPYKVPKKMGIYQEVNSENTLTTADIVERIIRNRLEFEARNKKKELKELRILEALEKEKREKSDGEKPVL